MGIERSFRLEHERSLTDMTSSREKTILIMMISQAVNTDEHESRSAGMQIE